MFCNVAILINTVYLFIIIFSLVVLAHEDTKNANIHLFISEKNGGIQHYSATFSRTSSIFVGVTLIILNSYRPIEIISCNFGKL
ncbi:hypothetical protein F3F90_18695 [Bacteroides salyersiae]|jgi:predicted ABC-type exoprotein transport system permease subunit|uniref:Uncharacterized protein n=1 Tax=Bacteroides salyersiae TaxID=291644 RepID=A0A7J4XNP3_9BACE|nr:hypothetical protein F3F90_18695 [Bacteroides salyersiae]KAA3693092.1 hypothetical protein F3F88_18400 [Bacteroides salyersiae]KAA3694604.1 hypothetical protein F3F89_16890 [Bacteroides salyersiae]KAA3704458.1 hypothetical protein F3G09_18810 [Bacteroides salyersiae]KAA3705364.1 hypothetical protein F3F83_13370 [Bacteroides salyersiae]